MRTLLIVLAMATMIGAAVLLGVDAPVHGQPMLAGCGPSTAQAEGPSKPIPNDPQNRKGWLDEFQVDDAGNKLEVWCIEIAGGVGNSYGYRYIPAGGQPRWIARCAFKGGVNRDTKEPTADANKNTRPDGWSKVTWTSEDDGGGGAGDPKDDDKVAGKKDYDWEYTPGNPGNLKRWETNNGVRINPNNPDFDGPPPQNFGDLFPQPPDNPGQDDDMKEKPGVKVNLHGRVGTNYNYELIGNDLTEFSPTMIYTGDKWSMAVVGVTAATAPVGWSVNFTSTYVTWAYTDASPINLSSAGPVSGFTVTSSVLPGMLYWLSDSADDDLANFGYAGTVPTGGGGGIAEPIVLGSEPAAETSASGASRDYTAPIAAAAGIAGVLATVAGGWYVRRRLS